MALPLFHTYALWLHACLFYLWYKKQNQNIQTKKMIFFRPLHEILLPYPMHRIFPEILKKSSVCIRPMRIQNNKSDDPDPTSRIQKVNITDKV